MNAQLKESVDCEPATVLAVQEAPQQAPQECETGAFVDPPTEEAVTREMLADYVSKFADIDDDKKDVFDILAVALAAERLDPILARIRSRSDVMRILANLSDATFLLTSIGAAWGIQVRGQDVVPEHNFAVWPSARLAELSAKIRARADVALGQNAQMQEEIARLSLRTNTDEEKIASLLKMLESERSVAEERIRHSHASALRANTILTSYQDRAEFVIARVDPVTRNPVHHIIIDGDKVRSAKDINQATKFATFREANNNRIRIVKARRAKMSRSSTERATVSQSYAVLQFSAREVTLETLDYHFLEGDE